METLRIIPKKKKKNRIDPDIIGILTGKQTRSPEFQIRLLPPKIKNYFISDAQFLLQDLLENTNQIILEDAPEKRYDIKQKIRKVQTRNPQRYSDLYTQINGSPNDKILKGGKWVKNKYATFHRKRCINSLEAIISEKDCKFKETRFKYHYVLRNLIFQRLTQGYMLNDDFISPINEVNRFFGINLEKTSIGTKTQASN